MTQFMQCCAVVATGIGKVRGGGEVDTIIRWAVERLEPLVSNVSAGALHDLLRHWTSIPGEFRGRGAVFLRQLLDLIQIEDVEDF